MKIFYFCYFCYCHTNQFFVNIYTQRPGVKVSSRSSNFTNSRMSSDSNNSDRSWPPRDREDPAEWSQSEESDSRETPYVDTPSEASDSEASLLNFIGELVDDVMEEDEEAHRERLDQHAGEGPAPRDFISEMMDEAEDGSNENNESIRRVPRPHLHELQLDSEGETERSSTTADKSESDVESVTTE